MGLNGYTETEEKNREAFKARYGIDIPECSEEKLKKFSVTEAKDGSRVLWAQENGVDIRLNSLYDPAHEALRWAEKYKSLPNINTTIALQGLLNGYYLRALKHTLRPNVSFIVYETSEEMFCFVCKHFNLVDIFEDTRIKIVIPSMGDEAFYNELYEATDPVKTQIIGVVTPGYIKDRRFSDICEQISIIKESNDGFRTSMAKVAFRSTMHSFSVLNSNYLVYDLEQNFPKDIPVFLVAGGPSLLKNVDELKKAKSKALIVAVDRAVSVLINHGIVPEMMVTIDPVKSPSFLDYKEAEGAYLLIGFGASREAMIRHEGHLVFMHSDVRFNELPGLKGRLLSFGDVGGGVAPAAFIHFLHMRVNNLVLVGQDLAIEGDVTHADGKSDRIVEEELLEVDGINGGKVKTRWDFNRFIDFMERKMREYPDTVVTDATEGGAIIHGTKVRSLKETVEELCVRDWDIDSLFSNMPKGQTDEQHEETVDWMCKRLEEIERIKAISGDLSEICRQLTDVCKYGDISEKKHFKKIDKMTELKNELYQCRANDWLEETWVTDLNTVPDPFVVVRTNEEAYPVFAGSKRYYDALPEFCDSLKDVIREEFQISEDEYKRRIGAD